jgi:hypothetical protein
MDADAEDQQAEAAHGLEFVLAELGAQGGRGDLLADVGFEGFVHDGPWLLLSRPLAGKPAPTGAQSWELACPRRGKGVDQFCDSTPLAHGR